MKHICAELSQVCLAHSVSPLRDVVINFNINIHEVQVGKAYLYLNLKIECRLKIHGNINQKPSSILTNKEINKKMHLAFSCVFCRFKNKIFE